MADEKESLQQHAGGQRSYGELHNAEDKVSTIAGDHGSTEVKENNAPQAEQAGRNWKHEILFLTLFISNMFTFMTFSLMGPLFPAEAKSKGVSYTVQGWIFAIYAFTQVCKVFCLIPPIPPPNKRQLKVAFLEKT